MGHTIWVDVRDRSEDQVRQDNSIMLKLQTNLESLSAKLNVPKLSDFYDYSELEAHYGGLEDETDDPAQVEENGSAPGVEWYDPEPALAAVRAIRAHLTQHPEDLEFQPDPQRAHWPARLMEELRHCIDALETARSRGQQFRFLLVP